MIEHAISDYASYQLLLGYLSPADHASLRLVSRSWQDCISRSCDDFEHLHLITGLRRLKLSEFEFTDEAFEVGIAACTGLQVLHLESQQAMLQVRCLRHLSGLVQLQELCLKPRGYINVPAEAAVGIAALGRLTKLTQLVLTTSLKPPRGSNSGNDAGAFSGPMPGLSGAPAGRPVYFDAFTTQQLSHSISKMRGLQVLRVAAPATLPAAVSGLTHLKELSLERIGHLNRAAVASLVNLKQLTALTLIVAAEPSDLQSHYTAAQQQQQWQAAVPPAAAAGALGHQPQQQQHQDGDLGAHGDEPAAAAEHLHHTARQYSSSSSSSSGLDDNVYLPLMQLPNLQELVVGCIARTQTLNLSTTLTHNLSPPPYVGETLATPAPHQGSRARGSHRDAGCRPRQQPGLGLEHQGHQGSRGRYGVVHQQGLGSTGSSKTLGGYPQPGHPGEQQQQQGEWFFQGLGGERYQQEDGESTSAYVCPDQWSQLAHMQGLQHVVVEARGWHSAAVTARYTSVAEAVSSMMTWPCVGLLDPYAAAAGNSSSGAGTRLLAGLAHMVGLVNHNHSSNSSSRGMDPRFGADPGNRSVTDHLSEVWSQSDHYMHSSTGSSRRYRAARARQQPAAAADPAVSAGAVGVFINHPSQQGYLPGLPQLLVLALRPGMSRLGLIQRQLVHQHLMAVQQAGLHAAQHQLLLGGTVPLPESPARQLLLAQLRASMHPSKLIIVLAASATHIRRLEVTVDQSWPPAVLSSLGHLQKLPHLEILKLDCGRQDPPLEMWTGLSGLTNLKWLCLRWLEGLPVSCLANMSKLVVLQLKAISNPPGAAELAEVMAGMPNLQALAIEGGLLDVEGDWLRDTAGLLRHGRWTSSWVEHTLCRQQHLKVLGSITAALLMAVVLNSPKLPEMIVTAILAAISGTIFVLAVAASLVSLMLDPRGPAAAAAAGPDAAAAAGAGFSWQQLQQQASGLLRSAGGSAAAAAAAAADGDDDHLPAEQAAHDGSSGSSSRLRSLLGWTWCAGLAIVKWGFNMYCWMFLWPFWAGYWACYAVMHHCWCHVVRAWPWNRSAASSSSESHLHAAAAQATTAAAAVVQQILPVPLLQHKPQQMQSPMQPEQQQQSAAGATTPGFTDPGTAFRRLKYFSLRRCTLTCRARTALISNQPWQLTSLMTQLPPGLWSQLVAAFLGLLLWPLAALGALSRIVASSSYQAAGATGGLWAGFSNLGELVGLKAQGLAVSNSTGPGSNPSRRGRGLFAGWGWYWDELCGLLQAAANKVEVAAVGHGSALLGLVSEMPNLRYLDVTWLNLEPWELHGLVQLKQLHYLGLGKQQIGVVLSAEAQIARNLQRGWRGRGRRRKRGGQGLSGALGGWDSLLITPFLWLRWAWFAGPWTWWHNRYNNSSSNINSQGGFRPPGARVSHGGPGLGFGREFDVCWLEDGGSSMVIVEAPAGFDEVLERDIMTTAA